MANEQPQQQGAVRELDRVNTPEPSRKRARPRARRSSQERRLEIAEATLRLMARYGLRGATVSRIAQEVGIAPQSLYAHYRSQNDMLMAAIDPLFDMTELWIASSPEPNVLKRLKEIGDAHLSFLTARLEGFVVPAFEFVSAPRDTGLAEAFGRRQIEQLKRISEIIAEGKKQGTIREDVDCMRAAYRLIIFAWAEDVAELMGIHEFIAEGISKEILDVLLTDLAPSKTDALPAQTAECDKA